MDLRLHPCSVAPAEGPEKCPPPPQGLHATTPQFARDLLNLTLASPSLNRSQKGDKDAAEWMPDQNRCWFAQTIVDVRLMYGLTIDQ